VTASTDRVAVAALGSIRMPETPSQGTVTKVGGFTRDSGRTDVGVWVDFGDGEVRCEAEQAVIDRIVAAMAGNTTTALIGRIALVVRFNGAPYVMGLAGTT
jgi:hypothetical protein